jgi:hypothetical protein
MTNGRRIELRGEESGEASGPETQVRNGWDRGTSSLPVRSALGPSNGHAANLLRRIGETMNDETRKLLKIFGVATTDAEAEAEKLIAKASQLSTNSSKEEIAALLKDGADLCRELNTRWLEITERVFAIQSRLQTQLAEAAAELQRAK